MPANRDVIYSMDFTVQQTLYRLELRPTASTPLPATPTRQSFPRDAILNALTIKSEIDKLPIGLVQVNELELSIRLNALTGDLREIITEPAYDIAQDTGTVVQTIQPGQEFSFQELVWAGRTIPSTYAQWVEFLRIEDDGNGNQTYIYRVLPNAPQGRVTFIGTGLGFVETRQLFQIGTGAALELGLRDIWQFGNVWRLYTLNTNNTVKDIVFEGMQKRVPSLEITRSADGTETIKAVIVDTFRASAEQVQTSELTGYINAISMNYVDEIATQHPTKSYKPKSGQRFYFMSLNVVISTLAELCRNQYRKIIRSSTATFTIPNINPSITYYANGQATTNMDMMFVPIIKDLQKGDIVGGWCLQMEEKHSNGFDLLTVLAETFLAKAKAVATTEGIELRHKQPLANFANTKPTIALKNWVGDRTDIIGGNSIRGTIANVLMSGENDKTEVKNVQFASEREGEYSAQVLLHNIPSFAIAEHESLLFSMQFGQGKIYDQGVKIDMGIKTFERDADLPFPANDIADIYIVQTQDKRGTANVLTKATTEIFGFPTIKLITGTVSADVVNSTMVGNTVRLQDMNVDGTIVSIEADIVKHQCKIGVLTHPF